MTLLTSIWPVSGQTVKFDWISIVYIVIVLISLIVGIKKGFISSLISFFGVLAALVIAYFTCKAVGQWLSSFNNWGTTVNDSIYNWLLGKSDQASTVLGTKSEAETALPSVLSALSIPSFLNSFIITTVVALIPETGATEAIGTYIANAVSNIFFTVLGFLLVFILALIVLLIIKILTKGINKNKILGPLNRTIGGILGLAIGVMFVLVISFGLSVFSANGTIYDYLNGILYLSDDSVWTIGKMLFTNNFFNTLLGFVQ